MTFCGYETIMICLFIRGRGQIGAEPSENITKYHTSGVDKSYVLITYLSLRRVNQLN